MERGDDARQGCQLALEILKQIEANPPTSLSSFIGGLFSMLFYGICKLGDMSEKDEVIAFGEALATVMIENTLAEKKEAGHESPPVGSDKRTLN